MGCSKVTFVKVLGQICGLLSSGFGLFPPSSHPPPSNLVPRAPRTCGPGPGGTEDAHVAIWLLRHDTHPPHSPRAASDAAQCSLQPAMEAGGGRNTSQRRNAHGSEGGDGPTTGDGPHPSPPQSPVVLWDHRASCFSQPNYKECIYTQTSHFCVCTQTTPTSLSGLQMRNFAYIRILHR